MVTRSRRQGSGVLACPACQEPLSTIDRQYGCPTGHRYDLAREGYVNLLLPQHRHSKDPGYSREMIAGRRDFFDAGHYEPLADDLASLLADLLPGGPGQVVLDAGCGEGYYLRRLGLELTRRGMADETTRCGLDISKHGVRVASRRDPAGLYAVAGTFAMPVLPGRVDVLLTHFSPVSADDFARVVPTGGAVVVGGPGERHLYSFKELLYEHPALHAAPDQLAADPRFELVETRPSRHPLVLGPGEASQLLLMTPFFWTLDAAGQARLAEVESLRTEIDVVLRTYRRTATAAEDEPARVADPASAAPRTSGSAPPCRGHS